MILRELTRTTHDYGAFVSMRIPSLPHGFGSVTKERPEPAKATLPGWTIILVGVCIRFRVRQ
jgi:hypothetical protein